MRERIQTSPHLYRRGAEETSRRIERARTEQIEQLNEPREFRLPAPGGPQSGPGDLTPPDRAAIDRPMGQEISSQTVEGSGNVDVTITNKGSNVEASGGGMFEGNVETTQERQLQ